jgi:hypothetical protein
MTGHDRGGLRQERGGLRDGEHVQVPVDGDQQDVGIDLSCTDPSGPTFPPTGPNPSPTDDSKPMACYWARPGNCSIRPQ